jgi:hypothetical protein
MKKQDQLRRIPNPLYNIRYGENDDFSPQSKVLVYAKDATGMQKIWSREDLRQLVFRMMLAFPDLEISQNYFCGNCLFEFRHKGKRMKIETEDLPACLGLHTSNLPGNPTDLDSWIDDLEEYLREAGKSAGGVWSISPRPEEDLKLKKRFDALCRDDEELTDKQVNDMLIGKPLYFPERESHEVGSYDDEEFVELVVYPDRDDIDRARFVADDLVDSLPEEAFMVFEKSAKKYLNEVPRLEQLFCTPLARDFRMDRLPEAACEKILRYLMKEDYRDDMSYSEFLRSDLAYIEDLAHLIWARHHNLIFCMYEPRVDSRWQVDLRKFDGLGNAEGINLQQTWDYFRLWEIQHVFGR